jgi:hypothetical protein
MGVYTRLGQEPWKNVEITGYAKVISANSLSGDHLDWHARGGIHTLDAPCSIDKRIHTFIEDCLKTQVRSLNYPCFGYMVELYTALRDLIHVYQFSKIDNKWFASVVYSYFNFLVSIDECQV